MDSQILGEEDWEVLHADVASYGAEVFTEGGWVSECSFAGAMVWVGDVYHHRSLKGVEGLKSSTIFWCS